MSQNALNKGRTGGIEERENEREEKSTKRREGNLREREIEEKRTKEKENRGN